MILLQPFAISTKHTITHEVKTDETSPFFSSKSSYLKMKLKILWRNKFTCKEYLCISIYSTKKDNKYPLAYGLVTHSNEKCMLKDTCCFSFYTLKLKILKMIKSRAKVSRALKLSLFIFDTFKKALQVH